MFEINKKYLMDDNQVVVCRECGTGDRQYVSHRP